MKKKIALCLIMGCLASALWGCNTKDIVQTISKDTEAEEEKETGKTDEEDADVEDESEKKEEEKSRTSKNPVLGDEDIEDYEDFTYLYCEEIRTDSEKNEETGKMESKKLSVFVPESDYVSVSSGRVRSEKLGVTLELELEPYIRYDADDYLVTENLEYLLESEYDPYYSNNYKDLVVSEVEEIDKNTAYATAEYCDYHKYDDSYSVVFATYLLKILDNDATVLVEIAVDSEEITGKTPGLIEELEAFYQIDIDWDKERAEAKLEDYLASGGESTVSTGYAIFELPEGWKEDVSESDYDTYVYAPDGDAEFAGCFVSIYREYLGYGTFEDGDIDDYQDEIIAMVEESMQEEDIDAAVSYYGKTCLGSAVKVEATITEDGDTADAHIYWIFDDSYGYVVTAVQTADALEDAFGVAEDMLENGQTR